MMVADPLANSLAANPQGLDSLRLLARQGNGTEAIKAGAQQLESFFLQMMMKSMRETQSEDGLFDSQETRSFTEMSDQQLAQNISRSKGIGLADMLAKQLTRMVEPNVIRAEPRPYSLQSGTSPAPVVQPSVPLSSTVQPSTTLPSDGPAAPRSFVDRMWPHAAAAGKEIGVAPHLLLGQAALESGWGKQAPRLPDGSSSHNLFNLKAGSNWKGGVVQAETTEYVNGAAQKRVENFRTYASDAEAFADYARLLKASPRYAGAVAAGGDSESFARGLQAGGYATDPMYSNKLVRLINSTSFRSALLSGQVSDG